MAGKRAPKWLPKLSRFHPEPPSAEVQQEIDRILATVDRELKKAV
jgi:hypothetical protein